MAVFNYNKYLYTSVWYVCELIIAIENKFIPNLTFILGLDTFANSKTSYGDAKSFILKDTKQTLQYLNTTLYVQEVNKRINKF